MPSRREFLTAIAASAASAALPGVRPSGTAVVQAETSRIAFGLPDPARHWRGDSSVGAALRQRRVPWEDENRSRLRVEPADLGPIPARLRERFRDLRRHFVFEYYPWYGTNPWQHWDQWGRRPPVDLAATSVPLLGPYDSASPAALEQHARWIAEAGAGAVNLSWWGPGDATDQRVHAVMDVMRAHDIHVTFHLEPYRDDRAARYVSDVLYLLKEYGERRHWDTLLLLEGADGRPAPVFKSFRTILPPLATDCHGIVSRVPDYTEDGDWRRQTDTLRESLRQDFDAPVLLADSLDIVRTRAAGFDGIAIYDNYVRPGAWPQAASASSAGGLVFSFNVNPGFDGIAMRDVEPDSCYVPPEFEPPSDRVDWVRRQPTSAIAAMRVAQARIVESFETTLRLQTDARFENDRRGFFLVYLNSFNEWHEGHQFEPMKNRADLTAAEAAVGYHNPPNGRYRLDTLTALLSAVLQA